MNQKTNTATTKTEAAKAEPTRSSDAAPSIPDHEMLHPIGAGAYGEVWLARNVVGPQRGWPATWLAPSER